MSRALTTWLPPVALMVVSFAWTLDPAARPSHGAQTLLLCVASVIANVFVLRYHYTHPPHPKFVMLPARRWCLRAHVVSGSLELVAGLLAYALGSPALAIVTALAALLGHVPSAAYQVPVVFGVKPVMNAAYVYVIALHAWCAAHLLVEPGSEFWLLSTFLVLNIYVWVRACYYALLRLELFPRARYTVATLLAGLLLLPAVLGPAGNLCVLAFVALHAWLRRVTARDGDDRRALARERARTGFVDPVAKTLWTRAQLDAVGLTAPPAVEGSRALAAAVFQRLDRDGDGALDEDEVRELLAELGASEGFTRSFLVRFVARRRFDLAAFYAHVWREQSVQARLRARVDPRRRYTPDEQARVVFEQLDVDGAGTLDRFELRVLLVEWGLPEDEVERYIALFDEDRDEHISLGEFRRSFAPIWRYCFHLLETGELTHA